MQLNGRVVRASNALAEPQKVVWIWPGHYHENRLGDSARRLRRAARLSRSDLARVPPANRPSLPESPMRIVTGSCASAWGGQAARLAVVTS